MVAEKPHPNLGRPTPLRRVPDYADYASRPAGKGIFSSSVLPSTKFLRLNLL
jgi:hypothetical protein